MTEEETRAAERLALITEAEGFINTIERKHDIEIGQRLRSIVRDLHSHVAIAEDAAERRVDAGDKANARLLNEKEALEVENAALRDGAPEAEDPVALFEHLADGVDRLAARMRVAKIEEGGLYCGGCGRFIAENAQGVQDMRDEVVALRSTVEELRGFFNDAASLVMEDGDVVSLDGVLERLNSFDTFRTAGPNDATGDELTALRAKRLLDSLGWAAPEVHGAHILRAMDRLAHAVRLELESPWLSVLDHELPLPADPDAPQWIQVGGFIGGAWWSGCEHLETFVPHDRHFWRPIHEGDPPATGRDEEIDAAALAAAAEHRQAVANAAVERAESASRLAADAEAEPVTTCRICKAFVHPNGTCSADAYHIPL